MKQFGKIVLAVVVGCAIYDVVDGCLEATARVIRRRKKDSQRTERSNPVRESRIYSPKEDGRRPIGFKMKEDE